MTVIDPAAHGDTMHREIIARVQALGATGVDHLLYADGLLAQLLLMLGHLADVRRQRAAEHPFAAEQAILRALENAEAALFLLDVKDDV